MVFARDRHGRGFRGPLSTDPWMRIVSPTPDQRFARALGNAVARLRDITGPKLDDVDIRFTLTPSRVDPGESPTSTTNMNERGQWVITFHRMPIMTRLPSPELLDELVYELLVIEWAHLMGEDPGEIDPQYFL